MEQHLFNYKNFYSKYKKIDFCLLIFGLKFKYYCFTEKFIKFLLKIFNFQNFLGCIILPIFINFGPIQFWKIYQYCNKLSSFSFVL